MNTKVHPIFTRKIITHIISSVLLEFGPVLLFLASFSYVRIYEATMILMVATIISTIVTYRVQKRIPYLALYVAFITIIFGFLTIHFHNVKFIQMRDSLYDLTCALTLLVGLRFNILFLSLAFNTTIPMTTKAWHRLTYFWIIYFFIIAGSNEVARCVLTLNDWFIFKSFILVCTSLFGIFSLYMCYDSQTKDS